MMPGVISSRGLRVTVGNSMPYAFGTQATGGASLLTHSNNQVTGNASNGTVTGLASLQ
jgi:hypothetical protein